MMYSMPNVRQAYSTVPLDVNTPIWMRGPGYATGAHVVECVMDELAHELGVDPIEPRLRNEPDNDESSGLPFSSRRPRECYATGAREFGCAAATGDRGPLGTVTDWSAPARPPRSTTSAGCQPRHTCG